MSVEIPRFSCMIACLWLSHTEKWNVFLRNTCTEIFWPFFSSKSLNYNYAQLWLYIPERCTVTHRFGFWNNKSSSRTEYCLVCISASVRSIYMRNIQLNWMKNSWSHACYPAFLEINTHLIIITFLYIKKKIKQLAFALIMYNNMCITLNKGHYMQKLKYQTIDIQFLFWSHKWKNNQTNKQKYN